MSTLRGYSKQKIQDAEETFFDDSTAGLDADDVQTAIENISAGAGTGASPGFSFGRSGNTPSGTYLQNETVPSNVTGRPIDLDTGKIIQIVVSNQNINTFTIEIEEHDGTTYTSLGTYSLVSERSKKFTGLSVNLTSGKELAAKVSSGSCKNPIVTVYVKGGAL